MKRQSSRARVEQRRAINLHLAIEDAKRRCSVCRRALPATGAVERLADPRRFCSMDCLETADERAALDASR